MVFFLVLVVYVCVCSGIDFGNTCSMRGNFPRKSNEFTRDGAKNVSQKGGQRILTNADEKTAYDNGQLNAGNVP